MQRSWAILVGASLLVGCSSNSVPPPRTTEVKPRDTGVIDPLSDGEDLDQRSVSSAPRNGFPVNTPGRMNCAAFSPDNRYLTAGYSDGVVALWDVNTGEVVRSWCAFRDQIWFVGFLPSGDRIVTVGAEGILKLWVVPNVQRVRAVWLSRDGLPNFALAPDGQIALGVGAEGPRRARTYAIKMWSLPEGRLVGRIGEPEHHVSSITIAPDKKFALFGTRSTGENARVLELWDLEARKIVRSFEDKDGWAIAGPFDSDGNALVALMHPNDPEDPGRLSVWNTTTGKTVRHFEGDGWGPLSLATGGKGVVAIGKRVERGSGKVFVTLKGWHYRTGELCRSIDLDGSYPETIVFSNDGKLAFVATPATVTRYASDGLRKELWNMQTGELVRLFGLRVPGDP